MAGDLASGLAQEEMVLVTGGAYGIDGAVHRATLAEAGHTVAVLAGGIDRLYPAGHQDLLDRVADVGLLVSEVPIGVAPTGARFMARARIEAALSGSTTIVEAAIRSGALLVARHAHALGRPVGAVPGSVNSGVSAGTHRLLREGTARLVTDADDIRALVDQGPQAPRSGLSVDPLMVERRSLAPGQARSRDFGL